MRREARRLCWIILLFALTWAPYPVSADTPLEVTVATNRPWYQPGDRVVVSVTACNPTSTHVEEHYAALCDRDQFQVLRDLAGQPIAYSDFGPWCVPFNPIVILDPGQCDVISQWEWQQRAGGWPLSSGGDQVEPGRYYVIAHFLGSTTEPTAFRILAVDSPAYSVAYPD